MSGDMSMFKKMKERITDEVSSATNKLQNMQIIDQLASSIGQQMNSRNEAMPNQPLPEPSELLSNSSNSYSANNHYSLVDGSPTGEFGEDEELNSEISPQHQLFNEKSIKCLMPSNDKMITPDSKQTRYSLNQSINTVINIDELSSDLEDGLTDESFVDSSSKDDVEIDLLSDKEFNSSALSSNEKSSSKMNEPILRKILPVHKTKFRNVVHTLRNLNQKHENERAKLEAHINDLSQQTTALKLELDSVRQQSSHDSLISISTAASETDRAHASSPQPQGKTANKIKDYEKLIAKCKESLKSKNAQLKSLKDSLGEVEKFQESIDDLKHELAELRKSHETWTVSIAENKRVMHQEIENKNSEMEKYKSDIKELQNQVKEGHSKQNHLKTVIQGLESRLVNTSAAHQKERESLTKELTAAKNSAIKQVQKEHELQLERVKLDLEKSIEALKSEILGKDEQIIRTTEQRQELHEQNQELSKEFEETKRKLTDQLAIFDNLRSSHDKNLTELTELRQKLADAEKRAENSTSDADRVRSEELETKLERANKQIASLEEEKSRLTGELEEAANLAAKPRGECESCEGYRKQISDDAESYKQTLFDLNTRLNLMTTANADQEKALNTLKTERDVATEQIRSMREDLDEMNKKNESLARCIQDNETELQNQQEQLDQLASIKQDLENLKRENSAQTASLNQAKFELNDRNNELSQSRLEIDGLKAKLGDLESRLQTVVKNLDESNKEKEALVAGRASEERKRRDLEEQLVLTILAAMKNLETPNTSPGSDKTFEPSSGQQNLDTSDDSDHPDRNSSPNLLVLAEKLASLAVDRCQSYMTAQQRLQAVLLDNTMMSEELNRLRDEINTVNKEKTQETLTSLEETERLRSENQALIHDQQAYEEQISQLENDMANLTKQLEDEKSRPRSPAEKPVNGQGTTNNASVQTKEFLYPHDEGNESELVARDNEIEELRIILNEREEQLRDLEAMIKTQNSNSTSNNQNSSPTDGPDSTEFEYLKNIVYQFMLGKEPLMLARVISAVFKFDKDQIEQICKVQEIVQSAMKTSI